ncbi:MAG TPA: oxidative damage protection protein [Candidatus Nitrosotenuis sp.]|jgi:Fe-S cluster biosynthesis and repair protein YggX|nr:oxidative damage protection protein [Candidatus Nitrosotenuis sp.]
MPKTVFCQKLKRELPALERPPIPGELGKRIQENISAEAWKMFTEHFKRIINEYRLNMLDESSNEIFYAEIERFLFQDVEVAPEGYVPPQS